MTFPVVFHAGPFALHAYTLCMLAAVLIGTGIVVYEAGRRGRLGEPTLRVAFAALLGGVAGAKLSMLVFLGPATFWRLLPTIPAHGAAFTGALIGGYVAAVLVEWLCLASIAGFGYQLFLSSRGATCICDLLPGARQRSVVR